MSMIACSAAWSTCVTKSLARFDLTCSPLPPSSAARWMINPAVRSSGGAGGGSQKGLDGGGAGAGGGGGNDKVAFVFGGEGAGLPNEEVFACQYLVHIPANPEFSSLNLAQAVQVVAYELRMCVDLAMPFSRVEKRATVEDMEGLYAHLEEAATVSGFMTPQSRLRERWRRLVLRLPAMEREEVNILRGLLKALMSAAHGSNARRE